MLRKRVLAVSIVIVSNNDKDITKERSKLNLWRKLYIRRRELDILPLVGVSPVCQWPCLGVWVWSWIIWIQSPLSALTWIPLTIAQWTLSLWPVTRSPGRLFMKPIPRQKILRTKIEWTLYFIHISAAFILISFTQRAEVGSLEMETQDL